jgi:WSC domain
MPCAGDPTANCGGPGRLSLFNSTVNTQLPTNPTIPGYTYASCHTDSVAARVLTGAYTSANTMTVETCAAFCAGYKMFGVEYGTVSLSVDSEDEFRIVLIYCSGMLLWK